MGTQGQLVEPLARVRSDPRALRGPASDRRSSAARGKRAAVSQPDEQQPLDRAVAASHRNIDDLTCFARGGLTGQEQTEIEPEPVGQRSGRGTRDRLAADQAHAEHGGDRIGVGEPSTGELDIGQIRGQGHQPSFHDNDPGRQRGC